MSMTEQINVLVKTRNFERSQIDADEKQFRPNYSRKKRSLSNLDNNNQKWKVYDWAIFLSHFKLSVKLHNVVGRLLDS